MMRGTEHSTYIAYIAPRWERFKSPDSLRITGISVFFTSDEMTSPGHR